MRQLLALLLVAVAAIAILAGVFYRDLVGIAIPVGLVLGIAALVVQGPAAYQDGR